MIDFTQRSQFIANSLKVYDICFKIFLNFIINFKAIRYKLTALSKINHSNLK